MIDCHRLREHVTQEQYQDIKRQGTSFYFRLVARKSLTREAETHLKCLLHPLAIPTAGTRYRLRRDFENDEALGGKRLHFARRRMTERDRLPLREVDLGITERQHLARVDDVTLTIAVAELGVHLGVQRFGVQ